jgi:hypothetical protein
VQPDFAHSESIICSNPCTCRLLITDLLYNTFYNLINNVCDVCIIYHIAVNITPGYHIHMQVESIGPQAVNLKEKHRCMDTSTRKGD